MATYINTNEYWEELSAIANSAISDIEDAIAQQEIPTPYGIVYFDEKEDEVYIRKGEEETPLREEDTTTIICIADAINDYFSAHPEL